MRIDDQLEQEARDVAAWLRAHADDFAGVHVVRVDAEIDINDRGEPFIRLTVVLSDPEDPDEGWPYEPVSQMYDAVVREAGEAEHQMWAYLHVLSVSGEAAA